MKLYFFGTQNGDMPNPHRRHTSFAFEYKDKLYLFDAGENCAYTAAMMGLSLLSFRTVFISHTHMDHIGGLPNLIWYMVRLALTYPNATALDPKTDVYIPNMEVWDHIMGLLNNAEFGKHRGFRLEAHKVEDGLLFDEDGFRVTALHNTHVPKMSSGEDNHSYGFLIEAEGKRIVYSGDTGGVDEFIPLFPCDYAIVETGHMSALTIANRLIDIGKLPTEKLIYTHHGPTLQGFRFAENIRALDSILGDKYIIAEDKTVIEM